MVKWQRTVALAGATTLVAGAMAIVPAAAQAAASQPGGIAVWGGYIQVNDSSLVRASYPADQGPWTTSASGPSAGSEASSADEAKNILALRADGAVEALPGTNTPWSDTSPMAGKAAVAVTTNGTAAAAVVDDGSVVKWGFPRGVPNRTWTADELGGEAVDVGWVQPTQLSALLSDGRVALIDSNGPMIATKYATEETPTDEVLTGVVQLSGTSALREDGSVVSLDPVLGWSASIPANPDDPVTVITDTRAATESGKVYDIASNVEDAYFPEEQLEGTIVQLASAGRNNFAVRTSNNRVLTWGPEAADPSYDPNFKLPPALKDVEVLDLRGGSTFRAVVAGEMPDLGAMTATTEPVISGTPRVGQTLTATPAVFDDPTVTVSHQWFAGTAAIPGATDATLLLDEGQVDLSINFRSKATRDSDGATVWSSRSNVLGPVEPAFPALAVTTQPTISGAPQVGQTLVATPAVFNDANAAISHQWLAGDTIIAGATGTTLTLASDQLGKTITYISTATRSADGAVLASNASNAVGPVTPAQPTKVVPSATISAPSGTYGKASTVSVALSSGAAGNVTLRLDGAPIGTAAISGGTATFSVPATTRAGTHALAASYEGSATHAATSVAGTLSIAKAAASKPTFKASKVPTSKKAGKATVTVSVPSGLAKATGKIRVTLKKGGSTKRISVTLSGGKRSIKLPKLKKGTWKVTITYNGDGNYIKGTSKSYKVKIKK